MKKYSADVIYTLDGPPLKNHVIEIDDMGVIRAISPIEHHDMNEVHFYKGTIVPGFVNTHCHLELSHMKGKIDTGTGLLTFISNVVKHRNFPIEEILDAIKAGDEEMYESGIVAVGDISNKADSAAVKSTSKINYYTFVEMFDFMQPKLTKKTIDNYSEVYKKQSSDVRNKKSYVPHAPYTVSDEIYRFIADNNPDDGTVSIHNQETSAEDQLFVEKKGDFLSFYDTFGFDMTVFNATGQHSIHHAMKHLNPKNNVLFVHNTLTEREDIRTAIKWNPRTFWATCPNANLYIENKLPDYQAFLDEGAQMTIGTDSLTSNWQLSIWEEIKTIKKYNSFITIDTLLQWACANGAKALSYDHLGSIKIGKSPGLVHIDGDLSKSTDLSSTMSKRIV